MSPQPFDRNALHRLFDEVATELQTRNAHGNLYVIGGSALALAYDDTRTTHDVDARIEGDHGEVIRAIRTVSLRHGLPSTWINEQATPFMPRQSDDSATSVYQHPNLTIKAASLDHLIAMKLNSNRASDLNDVQRLIERSPKPITAVHLEQLVSALYGPDDINKNLALRIDSVELPEPPTIEPPGLGL